MKTPTTTEMYNALQPIADLHVECIGFEEEHEDDGFLLVCGIFQISVGVMKKARWVCANPLIASKHEYLEALAPFARIFLYKNETGVMVMHDAFVLTAEILREAHRVYYKYINNIDNKAS